MRLACFVVLAASTAFATGERITVTGAAAPLKDTLCFSMSCVGAGPRDFVVAGRAVKDGIEITVTSHTGQRRLTHVAATNAQGRVSSTDLVRATSLVLQSIEQGPIAAPKPVAAKRLSLKRLYARR